ncbi:MAG: SIS domain-containing protein [Clostridia bacterium]|nr:SIS domain-containing protein [Clostridia bacterium]
MSSLLSTLIERFPTLSECKNDVLSAYNLMIECYDNGGKLLCCGNGGSAADCDHLVGELMKGFLKKRYLSDDEKSKFDDVILAKGLQKGLPAISLCAHSALMTAFSNDEAPSYVFAQQVFAYAKNNDLLFAFSTSGNSENVVYAAKAAKAAGIKSVAITGQKESQLSEICDVCIRIPESETFRIQELTLPVYHCLAAMIEENYFDV